MRSILEFLIVVLTHIGLLRATASAFSACSWTLASLFAGGVCFHILWFITWAYPFPWKRSQVNNSEAFAFFFILGSLVAAGSLSDPVWASRLFFATLAPTTLFWSYLTWTRWRRSKVNRKSDDALYHGLVTHTRAISARRSFTYSIYLMYTEIFEDDKNQQGRYDSLPGFDRSDGDVFSLSISLFEPRDYLSFSQIKALVETESKEVEIARIFLLTHWKHFGLKFNPISYYYCYNSENQLVAVVNEVHNTPWGEMTRYPVLLSPARMRNDKFQADFSKTMHVSPFMQMNYDYIAYYLPPAQKLEVFWEMHRQGGGQLDFVVAMNLRRLSLSWTNLLWIHLRYPMMTYKVMLLIYYQAAILWFKGIKFVDHPKWSKKEKESTLASK